MLKGSSYLRYEKGAPTETREAMTLNEGKQRKRPSRRLWRRPHGRCGSEQGRQII